MALTLPQWLASAALLASLFLLAAYYAALPFFSRRENRLSNLLLSYAFLFGMSALFMASAAWFFVVFNRI